MAKQLCIIQTTDNLFVHGFADASKLPGSFDSCVFVHISP